ncbi:MAG: class II fructose-bisphosphate aldolase [Candidatus Magasanikbacteria bacterium]|nr:class II fructose-bisphosphate aldolase [Candidatus Magasanikbacteria bacterium]
MLVNLNVILQKARKGGYAVPAFNINNLEICQAVIDAAEALKSPVVLQTSEGALEYAGMEYLAAIAHVAAKNTPVPVVFHLDHGKNEKLVREAIHSGFYTSVMFDGSLLPFKQNVARTRAIVKLAHARKMTVEAELGPIAGVEDLVSVKEREAFFTDPAQAEQFVKETGCDALAISIGTAHGAYKSRAEGPIKLDLKRLKEISARVKIPLVLHGASGISKKWLDRLHAQCAKLGDCDRLAGAHGIPLAEEKKAIKLGIAKINIDSDLRIAFTAGVRETLLSNTHEFDPRKILGPARARMTELVKEKIYAFGSHGRG